VQDKAENKGENKSREMTSPHNGEKKASVSPKQERKDVPRGADNAGAGSSDRKAEDARGPAASGPGSSSNVSQGVLKGRASAWGKK